MEQFTRSNLQNDGNRPEKHMNTKESVIKLVLIRKTARFNCCWHFSSLIEMYTCLLKSECKMICLHLNNSDIISTAVFCSILTVWFWFYLVENKNSRFIFSNVHPSSFNDSFGRVGTISNRGASYQTLVLSTGLDRDT